MRLLSRSLAAVGLPGNLRFGPALRAWTALLAVLFLAGGCRLELLPPPPVPPPEIRDDLPQASLRAAVAESLRFLDAVPAERLLSEWPRRVTAADVRESLTEFLAVLDEPGGPDGGWQERLAERFDFFAAPRDEVLFTGYYQPVIEASPVETGDYRYPVYREPEESRWLRARNLPGHSRRDIDVLGRLDGKGYELAWLRDPVDRFFLHIQGSGLLRMTDGRELPLNYAASNGRRYTSIGKILIDEGKVDRESMSMQRIRAYLAEFPDQREPLFARNPRYIFFRLGEQGPLGTLGVPLTAGRSAATDHGIYPKGALLFVETRTPVLDQHGKLAGWRTVKQFVLNQDAGAAIQGPARADLYFGSGDGAGAGAGYMQSTGRLYLLMKRRAASFN